MVKLLPIEQSVMVPETIASQDLVNPYNNHHTSTSSSALARRTNPQQESPISPFLALPAELRNQIYILLLTSPFIPALRQISSRGHVSDYILPSLGLTPCLLATCRQIHNEALGVLYGANTFVAHPSLLAALPHLITPRRPVLTGPGLRNMRKWLVNLRLDVDPKFDAEGAAHAFSGADELQIDVFQAMYGSCDLAALRLFEGVRGVGVAKVVGSTGCGTYARWLERAMMTAVGDAVEPFDESTQWEAWSHGNR